MSKKRKEKIYDEPALTEGTKIWAALESIDSYFKNKRTPSGNRLLQSELHSELNVNLVRYTSLDAACDYMYNHLIPRLQPPADYDDLTLTWDVSYALELLKEAQSHSVPRTHIPGLILLYFKYCKGFDVPYPVPEPIAA